MATALHYRAYKLNPAGRIVSGEWVEAYDDEAARKLAHALCEVATPTVELWLHERRVAVIHCDLDAASM